MKANNSKPTDCVPRARWRVKYRQGRWEGKGGGGGEGRGEEGVGGRREGGGKEGKRRAKGMGLSDGSLFQVQTFPPRIKFFFSFFSIRG